MRNLLFLILAALVISSASYADDCEDWFAASKILKSSKDCDIKCAILKTDMATFMCPDRCEALCSAASEDTRQELNRIVYMSGLTADELLLIGKHPKEALLVYQAKDTAQDAVKRYFSTDIPDSESDAFRHFIWSAVLRKELGRNLASDFLNAHEAGNSSDDPGTKMDKSNNQAGMNSSEKLEREKRWNEKNLEEEGIKLLKGKSLTVLEKGNLPKVR